MAQLRGRNRFSEWRTEGTLRRNRARRRLVAILAALGVGLLLGVGLAVSGGGAPLQTEGPTVQAVETSPTADPPGTIDGAKNPELIPDEVALRMIVLAVAEPADATEEMKERARTKLNPIGFSEDDSTAFLELLSEFQTQAGALDKQMADILARAPIPHPASTDYATLVDLSRQGDQLLTGTVTAIPARLSADGLEKLQAYLPQAKRGMKMMP